MSNSVEQIVTAFEGEIATTLGASYSELLYKYEVEKNSFKTNDKRYGVVPLGAEFVTGPNKYATVDHEFQVVLTHGYSMNQDSTDKESKVLLLFDKMNDIYTAVENQKLSLPNLILVVNGITIEEPEFFEDQYVVALRGTYNIKYRNLLT